MASKRPGGDWQFVGREEEAGACVQVWRHETGCVELVSFNPGQVFSRDAASRIAELIQRAAMPGQPLTIAAVSEDAMEALGQLADAVQEAGDE